MSPLSAFGRFWWDFVIGDDWHTAAGVVTAIAATAALNATGIAAWWVLPPTVVLALYLSLRRAAAGSRPSGSPGISPHSS